MAERLPRGLEDGGERDHHGHQPARDRVVAARRRDAAEHRARYHAVAKPIRARQHVGAAPGEANQGEAREAETVRHLLHVVLPHPRTEE